jgi:hypothetical protein
MRVMRGFMVLGSKRGIGGVGGLWLCARWASVQGLGSGSARWGGWLLRPGGELARWVGSGSCVQSARWALASSRALGSGSCVQGSCSWLLACGGWACVHAGPRRFRFSDPASGHKKTTPGIVQGWLRWALGSCVQGLSRCYRRRLPGRLKARQHWQALRAKRPGLRRCFASRANQY